MKVAVLTSLYPSAVRPFEGIFAERRWQGMLARGHDVRVVHPLPRAPWLPGGLGRPDWDELRRTPAREDRGGIAVERPRYLHVPRRARGNARRFASLGLRTIVAGGRPDVIVADYAWPAGVAAHACREQGLPLVISGRGSDVLQVAGEAGLGDELAAALVAAGHWCAVSQDLVDAMDRLAQRPGQGVLVPNGVDLKLFAPTDRGAARAELGLDADADRAPLVLVVGHLIPRKDPLLALRTVAELGARRPEPRVVFVGDGPLREELSTAARELGFGARFRHVPRAEPSELARWYSAADALLLTSWREGRPNVVLEALACGRPVLATEAGGTAELLEGLEGMLARTREARQLAGLLDALLARAWPPDELRAHVQGFSWEAGLDSLERCLQGALS